MDAPPLPEYVRQVYDLSLPGLHGLKKLLVDAHTWVDRVGKGQVTTLIDHLPDFQAHVAATIKDIRTAKYVFDARQSEQSSELRDR